MSTKDITAELGIGSRGAGMLTGDQLAIPVAEAMPAETHGPEVQPGSLVDLIRLRGRAENYFNWLAVFLGVLLIRWFVWGGDGLILVEGVAYLAGGATLWRRNRASLVGAGMVAGGALIAVIDRLEASAGFEVSTAFYLLLTLEIALGVRYGLRIRSILTGNGPVDDRADRADHRTEFTLAKPVRQVAGACIATGVIYLLVTVMLSGMAFELQEFFGIGYGDMWFLDLPIVGMEIVEDLALILAGAVFIMARAAWARAVLIALCGVYALEWWLTALSGYELTLKELGFALFWSFGFTVLASRRRVDEFAEIEGGRNAFTVPEQLDAVIRVAEQLED